jgi:2-keto-4-pentenoate hydratase/2-oxohepta-3-ene-1,7-dioic acid hydratase in catechol pathway
VRLVSYRAAGGEWRGGLVVGDQVVDVGAAGAHAGLAGPDGIRSVRDVLAAGAEAQAALAAAAQRSDGRLALDSVRLGPPVPDPDKILCLGFNYAEHNAEMTTEAPAAPNLFAKFRSSLAGSGDPIVLPRISDQIDYEGELAVVVGRRGKDVTADDALAYVGGYMPFNDVSARDLQFRTSQFTAGKAIDTFAPCGPALITADEVADPDALHLVTRLNGEVVQDGNTADMIFGVAETLAFTSTVMTLEPGDIIATGTPPGVGSKRTPPRFLRDGDLIEVEIEGLGVLANPVVDGRERGS